MPSELTRQAAGLVYIARVPHGPHAALEVAAAIRDHWLHVDECHLHAHVVPLVGDGAVEVEGVIVLAEDRRRLASRIAALAREAVRVDDERMEVAP